MPTGENGGSEKGLTTEVGKWPWCWPKRELVKPVRTRASASTKQSIHLAERYGLEWEWKFNNPAAGVYIRCPLCGRQYDNPMDTLNCYNAHPDSKPLRIRKRRLE